MRKFEVYVQEVYDEPPSRLEALVERVQLILGALTLLVIVYHLL